MILDFRFSIFDWRRRLRVRIQNPKSKIQNCPRRGVSILEVLFAIMVTSIGLLGAIALFPVASSQARKAKINDEVANIGRSAVHTFDAMGMRRPDWWYYWDTTSSKFVQVYNPVAG